MGLLRHSGRALGTLRLAAAGAAGITTMGCVAGRFGLAESRGRDIVCGLAGGFPEILPLPPGGLARSASEIRVSAVIHATERAFALMECQRPPRGTCPLRTNGRPEQALSWAWIVFFAAVDRIALGDLLPQPEAVLTALARMSAVRFARCTATAQPSLDGWAAMGLREGKGSAWDARGSARD